MAGEASTVTTRSASRASPITASTCEPGSAFHGSLASRCALVARIRLHVASRARAGADSAQAVAVAAYVDRAASANGESGRGAGPMPSHFLPTTVATRANRFPRLFAKSEL